MPKDILICLALTYKNALEYILDNKIVHHDSMDEYKILCKHLKKSDKPISVVLDLLYKEGMYNRCKVTAKTVYGNGKRIKSVIVIESTGLMLNHKKENATAFSFLC